MCCSIIAIGTAKVVLFVLIAKILCFVAHIHDKDKQGGKSHDDQPAHDAHRQACGLLLEIARVQLGTEVQGGIEQVGVYRGRGLAAGLLTGKHARGRLAEHSRLKDNYGYNLRYVSDRNMDAVERLTADAQDSGMSLLELALQWLLNRPVVDSVIVGASRLAHVQQNLSLAAEKKPLSPEVLAACDAVWDDLRGRFFSYHANAKPMLRPPQPEEKA